MKGKTKSRSPYKTTTTSKRRMVAFRLREEVIEALADLTEEFNATSRVAFSKTAILEMLITNELKTIKRKLNEIGSQGNLKGEDDE